ncbi:MAG: hypothetical protein ACI9R3_003673 [Verrucomicrobiales bacterium]|jgi:hypothetical protein
MREAVLRGILAMERARLKWKLGFFAFGSIFNNYQIQVCDFPAKSVFFHRNRNSRNYWNSLFLCKALILK